jgi:hypothetical protein
MQPLQRWPQTQAALSAAQSPDTMPVGQQNPFSMPVSTGSCRENTTSSFPFVGNDVFLDFVHKVVVPGSDLNISGPSILFMHPQDAPAFASVVPKLQHQVVLVSNFNIDQCLPWAHGDNAASWRPHIDTVLNSSMVVSWYMLFCSNRV